MMAILKTLLFTIFVPGTVGILLPYRIARPHWPLEASSFAFLGALLFAFGAFLYLVSAWSFASRGRGTPAPIDPPKTLIVHGPNLLVRNPMYIGVLCVILGQAIIFHSWKLVMYGAGFILIAHLFVIFYEEPVLQKKFGSAYEQYRQSVPRWLPRF